MSYFFPPEVMGAHIGHHRCHATFRQHSIAFRGLTALFGHMGLELDPVTAGEEESAGYRRYASLYKEWRQLIHTGTLWRVDMPDAATQVQGWSARISRRRSSGEPACHAGSHPAGCSTFFGLAPQARYRLRVVDHPDIQLVGEGGHTMRRLPGWMNQTSDISGEWLAQAGIQLPVLDPKAPC